MQKVLLVTESQIKENSIIEKNVDSKILSNIIYTVQELQLKQIMGVELYISVLTEVQNSITNETPLSTETKELLDAYIVPFLTYATICDFIIVNNYKLSNKGMMKLNDNAASSSTANDLEYVKNHFDQKLASVKKRLVEHLKKDTSHKVPEINETHQAIGWFLETRPKYCID